MLAALAVRSFFRLAEFSKIVICYRRDDCAAYAGRIYHRLERDVGTQEQLPAH